MIGVYAGLYQDLIRPVFSSRQDSGNTALVSVLPDIFAELGPGASVEKMKSILGPPHAEGPPYSGALRSMRNGVGKMEDERPAWLTYDLPGSQYSYRFKDAFVQFLSADGQSISTLMVASRDPSSPAHISIHRTDVTLGKSRLYDMLEDGEELEIDHSSKHFLHSLYRYYGLPGGYLHYYFGNYEAANVMAPDEDLIINWVAVVSGEMKRPYFDWLHFE